LESTRLVSHRESLISASNIKSGKDKKEVLAKKKQEQVAVTQRESIAFSILYNNALFLFGVIVLGFFVFKSASAPLYAIPLLARSPLESRSHSLCLAILHRSKKIAATRITNVQLPAL
jgi:hypothetical protein